MSQGFQVGGEDFVEDMERGVVEADNWSDWSAMLVDLRLSMQLRPSRVKVSHLFEEFWSDLLVVT